MPNCCRFLTKQEAKTAASPALLEAQARLLSLRAQLGYAKTPSCKQADGGDTCARPAEQSGVRIGRLAPMTADQQAFEHLPQHLGWGSQGLAEQIKRSAANRQKKNRRRDSCPPTPPTLIDEAVNDPSLTTAAAAAGSTDGDQAQLPTRGEIERGSIRLHPDIGLGILRQKVAAPGRIWLLLRWIDQKGSGRIDIERARSLLCAENSALKVCGWRQMRSLLARGDGRFWQRHGGRIWLRSIPKVAHALDVTRLTGHPVELPLHALTSGIGQFRAHLYASFHSGRKQAQPISRTSLTRISQTSRRSQQHYERVTSVRKQKNFALGANLRHERAQEQSWRQGTASFKWDDHKAIFGAQKEARLAWQLPNSYQGPHARRPRGRQRQFNRELAVLSTKGMTGNDSSEVECLPKRYCNDAVEAIKTLSRHDAGVYWRGNHSGNWYFMESAGMG